MHSEITVLGTIDANMSRIIDTEYNERLFRWMTLVGLETGETLRIEGRGHSVRIMIELIVDRVHPDEAKFIASNGGAMVVVRLT